MKYLERINIKELLRKYDAIIGWGTGPIFRMNYKKDYFPMKYCIDGRGENIGKTIENVSICDKTILEKIEGKKLIIIYTIYENQICEQLGKYASEVDIIVYSLIDIELQNGIRIPEMNAKNCEDLLLVMLTKQLQMSSVQYLEIGVCHPIIRNNTYLLYELFSNAEEYKGVLVEANPICWDLIEEYRPRDTLVRCGVGKEECKKMKFYMFPNLLGHSTFLKESAEKKIKMGHICQQLDVDIIEINRIIEDNFGSIPDLLAIDAEGLDESILLAWDNEKYPFKIILCEIQEESKNIDGILLRKGYQLYASTIENQIWVHKDLTLFV